MTGRISRRDFLRKSGNLPVSDIGIGHRSSSVLLGSAFVPREESQPVGITVISGRLLK